ncbi:hypothetical protein TNCV_4537131 [Trichonephila clavipes]|nr:hypothetical protein TNCV_4537131 [Trichonephila clavipes]
MQVTVRVGSFFHPNFEGEHPASSHGPHISLPLPPTSQEDLRLDGYLEYSSCHEGIIHIQASIPYPGFEPRSHDTAVRVSAGLSNGRLGSAGLRRARISCT